ncbi:hypothetical protein C9J48_10020 [Photobacterium profundum]|uniref:Uncharacterized protein n=1 Tax=Photobacterium profundum 3TCK TaxID=314280 RepID=Q1Z3Q3_9GAMM|nr:hypothetical protein P3TCK_09663 [Photobacterium profundum 3TCK]PSV62301.1 hypothetical protein C9J48_10020 [Photobacterium profundum]
MLSATDSKIACTASVFYIVVVPAFMNERFSGLFFPYHNHAGEHQCPPGIQIFLSVETQKFIFCYFFPLLLYDHISNTILTSV